MVDFTNPFNAANVRYNASAFDGTVQTDLQKLGTVQESEKKGLIDYSVADFGEYKEALLDYVKAVYPDDYNNFYQSDFGIFMTELFSYLAATLSLKADFLANESYIDTVQTRENLTKILGILGVKIRGPVASKCTAVVKNDAGVAVSNSDQLTITNANRKVAVTSGRDSTNVSFTLFKTEPTNGGISQLLDTITGDLILDASTYYSDSTNQFSGLVLVEGEYKSISGRFPATQDPKTVLINDPSVIEGSIVVSAEDGVFSEIQSLALAKDGNDLVFEKRYNSDFSVNILFGDGVRGKNPTASTAYSIFYRTGGGDRGDIIDGTISQAISADLTGSSVSVTIQSTSKATGGQNVETVEHAKKYAPYFFKTQYRAVTGEDYTTIANSYITSVGSVGKAIAVNRQNGAAGNMIDIYTLLKSSENQFERANLDFKSKMLGYMNDFKMMTDEITIVDGLVRTLDMKATVFVDKSKRSLQDTIKSEVAGRVTDFMSIDNMDFGQTLRIDELANYVLQSNNIRFFRIDNYKDDIFVSHNEIIQLNNLTLNVEFV